MPTQNTNLDTTWLINQSDVDWILTEDAAIVTDAAPGIFVGSGTTGTDIFVDGDVTVTDNVHAVRIEGAYNNLHIGANAVIDGSDTNVGISGSNHELSIDNAGVVKGSVSAIAGYYETTVVNTGTIEGGTYGISGSYTDMIVDNSGRITGGTFGIATGVGGDDATITNRAGGVVRGDGAAIGLDDADGVAITNYGKLLGPVGIVAGDGETIVVNRGLIKGDVQLGGGVDRFDTRGGTVKGSVDGGAGNDIFLVDSQSLKIAEQDGFGLDTVKSTVSYTLGANLEDLLLLGKKHTDATGNGLANGLTGNAGDNVLKGLGGEDYLVGGKGDDIMVGGAAADIFDFRKGTGHDVINDFQDGKDLILSDFVNSQDDFEAMMDGHVKQQGDDLQIKFGGDTLLIKDMEKSDLDVTDFFFGL